jgi:predicted TIM-barrel fold metal-dependent hydrolase
MKIIDINCMLGTWPSFSLRFHDAPGLIREMDSYTIKESIAFHSMALWSPKRGNECIRETASESAGRIRSCYVLDPNLDSSVMPEYVILKKQLKEERPATVKLYPNTGMYSLDSFYCGELLELLNELSLPVLFDTDQMPPYDKLPGLAKAYPGIKFVLLRRPFNESRYVLPLLKKLDNVFFDMSIMVDSGLIEEIVLKYGSERLLFGSGMPFYSPAGALGLVMYSRINASDKENILSRNWEHIERSMQWE